jgi:two-component system response regulator MtrA
MTFTSETFAPGQPRPRETSMILVCEDDASLRELICAILRDEFEVSEAADGDEAIALAREVRPELMVLDIMLPGRSGLEVIGDVRSTAETAAMRVIAMSAWDDVADQAIQAGADAFLQKPFLPDELVARVRGMLGHP